MGLMVMVALTSAGRILLGLAPFLFPALAFKILKFPLAHDNESARVMARLFGVRDIGLGVLTIASYYNPATLGFVFLLNLATDLGDIISFAIAGKKDPAMRQAALNSSLIAASACCIWIFGWFYFI